MEKAQYNLCCEVLRRLDREGVLDHVVLIGSWCLLAYEDYFKNVRYRPGIRTRDIDLLVPVPPRFDHKVDIEALLKDLDFVISYKGKAGYIQFVHQDLMLEFIVPERGRGTGKPYPIPALGVNAQPLRFMHWGGTESYSLYEDHQISSAGQGVFAVRVTKLSGSGNMYLRMDSGSLWMFDTVPVNN